MKTLEQVKKFINEMIDDYRLVLNNNKGKNDLRIEKVYTEKMATSVEILDYIDSEAADEN